ncbi:VOC family protein, partial [Glycomyces halotolerans]
MIGSWHVMIFDCPEPRALAAFYGELLGMVETPSEYGDMVFIGEPGGRPGFAFQRVDDFAPPTWPDRAVPQQVHIDVRVEDLDEGERRVLAPGASPAARSSGSSPTRPDTPSASSWSSRNAVRLRVCEDDDVEGGLVSSPVDAVGSGVVF